MKVLFLFAIIIGTCWCVTLKQPSNAQIQKYNNLKKEGKWAGLLLKMAELQLQTGEVYAAVQELIEAIDAVSEDLAVKRENAAAEFERVTIKHEEDVAFYNGEINHAYEDISSTSELLNNFLYPNKASLEQNIEMLKTTIADAQATKKAAGEKRERDHNEYLSKMIDVEDAMGAVEEAKEKLAELFEGEASLLQIKKAQKSIKKVTEKIGGSVETSIVKALIALSTDQFNDSSKVKQVDDLLAKIYSNLVETRARFSDAESTAQQDYENQVIQLDDLVNRSTLDLNNSNQQLEQTIESIQYNEEFLAQRQRDLADLQDQLEEENKRYATAEEIYWDLDAQYESELASCAQAVQFLQDNSFANYIGNRISQDSDVIIDQYNGTGVTLEKDPFDFE